MITFRTAIRESKDFEINPLTVDARCKATSIICKGHHTLLKRRVKFIHCCRYFLNLTPVPLSLTWETHNSLNMSNKVPFELTSNMLTGLGTKTEEESRVPLICISPSGGRFLFGLELQLSAHPTSSLRHGRNRTRSNGVFPSGPRTLWLMIEAAWGTIHAISACRGGMCLPIRTSGHKTMVRRRHYFCLAAASTAPFDWLSYGGGCSSPT